MPSYLITGGGCGAKVAEAVTFLCAAGVGPDELHILRIDSDTTNGNLRLASDTISLYQKLQKWPWKLNLTGARSFFGTKLHDYALADAIDAPLGLKGLAGPDLQEVLDLLYDQNEQTTSMAQGFSARPNLGCMVLSDHLNTHFTRPGTGARTFIGALAHPAGAGAITTRIGVAASVFGGTGASLIPIIRGRVSAALGALGPVPNLDWGFCMLLPYFSPDAAAGAVDPRRLLLDTSSALAYYTTGGAAFAGPVYLMGSIFAKEQTVRASVGGPEQHNPAFLEELIGALAFLHFLDPANPVAPSLWLCQPPLDGKVPEWVSDLGFPVTLGLNHLPVFGAGDHAWQLSLLVQLAAFFLRDGRLSDGRCQAGLKQYLDMARAHPAELAKVRWYCELLDPWIQELSGIKDKRQKAGLLYQPRPGLEERMFEEAAPSAAAFFGRLLKWSQNMCLKDKDELSLRPEVESLVGPIAEGDTGTGKFHGKEAVLLKPSAGYVSLHNHLCKISREQIELPGARAGNDNALIRLLRAAHAAMLLEHQGAHGHESGRYHFQASQSQTLHHCAVELAVLGCQPLA